MYQMIGSNNAISKHTHTHTQVVGDLWTQDCQPGLKATIRFQDSGVNSFPLPYVK